MEANGPQHQPEGGLAPEMVKWSLLLSQAVCTGTQVSKQTDNAQGDSPLSGQKRTLSPAHPTPLGALPGQFSSSPLGNPWCPFYFCLTHAQHWGYLKAQTPLDERLDPPALGYSPTAAAKGHLSSCLPTGICVVATSPPLVTSWSRV